MNFLVILFFPFQVRVENWFQDKYMYYFKYQIYFLLFNFLLAGVSSVSWGSWTYPFLWRLNHRFYKTPKRFRGKGTFLTNCLISDENWVLTAAHCCAGQVFFFSKIIKHAKLCLQESMLSQNKQLQSQNWRILHFTRLQFFSNFQSSISKCQIPATMHVVAGGIKLNNFENEEEPRFLSWQLIYH